MKKIEEQKFHNAIELTEYMYNLPCNQYAKVFKIFLFDGYVLEVWEEEK